MEPLYHAIRTTNISEIKRLLHDSSIQIQQSNSINFNQPVAVTAKRRETVLLRAVSGILPTNDAFDLQVVEFLLRNGADPNLTQRTFYQKEETKNEDSMVITNSSFSSKFYWTPFRLAVKKGLSVDMILLLLYYRASIYPENDYIANLNWWNCVTSEQGKECIYDLDVLNLAVTKQRAHHLVPALLQLPFHLNHKLTALRRAIERGYLQVVKVIFEHLVHRKDRMDVMVPLKILECAGRQDLERPRRIPFVGSREFKQVQIIQYLLGAITPLLKKHFNSVCSDIRHPNELPKDVLKLILSKFDGNTVLGYSLVSKRWRKASALVEDISIQPQSLVHLFILSCRFETKRTLELNFALPTILYFANWLSHLQSLRLANGHLLSPEELRALGQSAISLQELDITHLQKGIYISKLVSWFPSVTHLAIEFDHFTDEQEITIASPRLTDFRISINHNLPAKYIFQATNLARLNMGNGGMPSLLQFLPNNSITHLILSPVSPLDEAIENLLLCTRLRALDLSNANNLIVTPLMLERLRSLEDVMLENHNVADEPRNYPHLYSVTRLHHLELGSQGLISLLNSFPNLAGFKTSSRTRDAVTVLKELKCTNLSNLDITMTTQGILECPEIVEVVCGFPYLTRLRLRKLSLSFHEFNQLLHSLKFLQELHLELLWGFTNCVITQPCLKVFRLRASSITSVHILAEDLEELEILDCEALTVLELHCDDIREVNVPGAKNIKIRASNPLVLDRFEE